MAKGGLIHDPGRILHDVDFQRSLIVNLSVLAALLTISAFYHFVLRTPKPLSKALTSATSGKDHGALDADIAEVDSLIVYPLKSGRGILLSEAQVSRKGFQYDRRWAIVRKEGLKRLNLKDEPKITHIIPSFQGDILHLRLGEASPVKLPDIGVPLDAGEELLASWPLIDNISFYGDFADGREVALAQRRKWQWKGTPSEWVSELLGYPVYFLQFEPSSSKRIAFPIVKPPHDVEQWEKTRQSELKTATDIEFQDLYPFLIATRESLQAVNTSIREAIATKAYKYDEAFWSKLDEPEIPIQRFRPNIVLRSRKVSSFGETPANGNDHSLYPPFSEDSWETIWIQSKEEEQEEGDGIAGRSKSLAIHLVARCARCTLTTVDPETAHRDPNLPLSFLRKNRKRIAQPTMAAGTQPCFGMYSIPEKPEGGYSKISVGDAVRVRWRPYELDDEVHLGHRARSS